MLLLLCWLCGCWFVGCAAAFAVVWCGIAVTFLVVVSWLLLWWLYGCCFGGYKALLWRCAAPSVVVKRLLLHWMVGLCCCASFPAAAVLPVQLLLGGSVALLKLWYCETVNVVVVMLLLLRCLCGSCCCSVSLPFITFIHHSFIHSFINIRWGPSSSQRSCYNIWDNVMPNCATLSF